MAEIAFDGQSSASVQNPAVGAATLFPDSAFTPPRWSVKFPFGNVRGPVAFANTRVFQPEDYVYNGTATPNTYDPTGTADSTATFTALMTAVNAFNDRCIVVIGPGVFKCSTGVLNFTSTAPQGIFGADRGTTVLIPVGATGDMVKFATGTDGCSVQNIALYQTGTPQTAGAGVRSNGADDLLISNVLFVNLFQDVLVDNSSIKVTITHTVHSQANGSATSVGVMVTNGLAGDTYIGPDCVFSNTGATRRRAGIEVTQSGHFEVNQCNVTGSAQGLLVDPGAGLIVGFGFVNETLFDSCTVNGATFSAPTATSTVKSITSMNSWYSGTVAGAGQAGVLTSGVAGGILNSVIHIGDRFLNNQTHGYQHGFGTGFAWTACQMRGNSAAANNASDGLNVAAAVSNWCVNGGRFGGSDTAEIAVNQRWGINVLAGASNNIKISPDDCSGNVTGPLSNNATGAVQIVTQFLGEAVPPVPPVGAVQAIAAAAATLIAGSVMSVQANSLRIGDEWELEIAGAVPTAVANTNTWIIRYGPLGTAADPAILTSAALVGGAAAATSDRRTLRFTILTLGAAATVRGEMVMNTNGVGLAPANANSSPLTAAAFNSTAAGQFLSASLTFVLATTTYNVSRVHWKKLK